MLTLAPHDLQSACIRERIQDARRKGKVAGAIAGFWSLLLD